MPSSAEEEQEGLEDIPKVGFNFGLIFSGLASFAPSIVSVSFLVFD